MDLDTLIARAQELRTEHGNLDCHSPDAFLIDGLSVEEAEDGEFPEDWNMPAGYKYIRVGVAN